MPVLGHHTLQVGYQVMKQLSAADSSMLFMETPTSPNHLSPLNIYDQSTAPAGKVTFKGILANLEARLHQAPMFRRRLVRVPFDIDEPYWVDDPHFDLEYHVRHLALPKPGDWRQLCIQVARLSSRPLDPTRPLWEMYVIEGLDNIADLPPGCFGILFKIHHCMVDGKAGVEILTALHDLEPNPPAQLTPSPQSWQPETQPTQWKLTSIGAGRMLVKPGHLLKVMARTAPSMLGRQKGHKPKVPLLVPKIPLNGHLTSARVYDSKFFSLKDFKLIRNLVPGATINDVAIAIVSGGMRKYLLSKKQLPKDSLIASIPISTRDSKGQNALEGNELVVQNIPIYTQAADPVKRLSAICNAMNDTKSYLSATGAKQLTELSAALPGKVGGLIAQAIIRISDISGGTLVCNTAITNVPGAQVPLYMTGAKLVRCCGAGPLVGNMGTIHIIGSYCGEISLNITGCRDLLPDPAFYTQCMEDAFNEYLQAAKKMTKEASSKEKVKRSKITRASSLSAVKTTIDAKAKVTPESR